MSKPTFEMTGSKDLDNLLKKINKGANINIKDKNGDTALILASKNENEYIDIVKLLIEHGADINIQNSDGDTALMMAHWNRSTDICKLLIGEGANLNIKNKNGDTILIIASLSGQIEICKYLINNGADINIKDRDGDTAVDIMENEGIYKQVEPYKILGLKHFHKVFKERAEDYIDIFNTTLYSLELELENIKANIEMFYSTIIARMENNTITEDLEL